ncbi:hypothetical protein EVAR_97683_1 [Eumeta japonica]|uniref:Uncharacterized protein n=1 Tax=Eumeta variegata TaxID=151549 RepID=A0A4C1X0S8_EUMVA|nr:hypothetical protein EVAR_97683_1 [Eumeta japonica]
MLDRHTIMQAVQCFLKMRRQLSLLIALTKYGRKVTISAVAFRPVSESLGGRFPFTAHSPPSLYSSLHHLNPVKMRINETRHLSLYSYFCSDKEVPLRNTTR